MKKLEATLEQSDLDRHKAAFIAKGGKIITVQVMESGEIIRDLKSKQKTRTIEEWTKLDVRNLEESKK